jgi:hypothetical protein
MSTENLVLEPDRATLRSVRAPQDWLFYEVIAVSSWMPA